MCKCFTCMYVYATIMCPLKSESQMTSKCHMGAENQTLVLCKDSKCSYTDPPLQPPKFIF